MPHPHGPELPSAGVYARGYEAPGEVCFWKEWSEDRVGDTSLVKPKLVFSVLAGLFISLLNPLSKIESRRPLDGSFETFVFTPDSLTEDPLVSPTPEPLLQMTVHRSTVRTDFESKDSEYTL